MRIATARTGFAVLFTLAASSTPAEQTVPTAGWLSRVEERITAEEYHVSWQPRTYLADVEAAWQAPNRAHGFRTYFTEAGPRLIPRNETDPSWEWGLALVGYGRGGRSRTLPSALLEPVGGRIDYERNVATEWYENSPRGLKQGFMLWVRPEDVAGVPHVGVPPRGTRGSPIHPERSGRLVHLDLRREGTLEPVISTDGQAVDFRTGRGVNVLHYAGLKVTDAGGRELASWIEGFSGEGLGGLRIVFDDEDAAYPVTVDPLATGPSWTAESDQAGAQLGISVATAGDVNGDGYSDAIVGAHLYDNGEANEGRAFAYHGSAAGLAATAAWTAESDQADAYFGRAVATAGDVNGDGYADVIVSATYFDNGETDEGRAFVFHGSAAGLSTAATWTAESDQAAAQFGISVATAGDVNGDGYGDVIVGSYFYDNGETNEGRAYVYHGSPSGLGTTAAWTAESDQVHAYFGGSVATAGDVNGDGYADVVVGADSFDSGETDEGRAFVYHGSAAGLGVTAAWTAEGDQASAYFAHSVGAAGDLNGDGYADVIVGAYSYDNGQTDEGRVFAYHGSAAGLAATAAWTAESDQADANLGFSVATAGDVNGDGYGDVIAGAYRYDAGETDEGRAYVYHGSATGLATAAAWTAESDQASAQFGYSVGPAGDVNGDGSTDVIVGARFYDNGQADEGRAFVYHGSAAGLQQTAGWTAEGGQADSQLGLSVGTAGDVNGDGFADVVVGAYAYDNGQTDEGRAYVYHGSAAGLATTAAWMAEGDQADARFGRAAGTAGDVNGDGFADVIVGAYRYGNGENEEGRAFVYHGSATGLAATAAWTAESDQAGAWLGDSVGTAGDVNGDGFADVIVGAYRYDNGQTDEGRAYVYHGSASGLAATAAWTVESNQAGVQFGKSVGTARDVNGDGYADVIVGAPFYDGGELYEGRALVYHGSAAGLAATAAWTAESDQADARFGYSVGSAGDVNGDGYADVIVGAYLYDNGQTDEGRAYVYHGSAAGLATTPAWTAESDQADAGFGISAGAAGDVNGDGYADSIVGAFAYDNGETNEGRAYVYHGSAAGLATTPAWTAESDQAAAQFGESVGTAGDVNGDGYAEAVVGSRLYDGGQTNDGRVFVYYGNEGPGLSLRPEQRRADDAGPIAWLGHSRSPDGFRLAAFGRSPFGRTNVKLEWEVKVAGQFLDGSNTNVGSTWSDTGTAGTSLSEPVAGPEPGGYHWRVRLLYDSVTSPFLGASRWFTIPRGGQEETDLVQASIIGGVVWLDADRDGIREAGEAMLGSITVQLLDDLATVVDQALTDAGGGYHFEVDSGQSFRLKFVLPAGYEFTARDRGVDDTLDSDAHTLTGETDLVTPPYQAFDAGGWSAGMLQQGPCLAPDEAVYIYTITTDANGNQVLHFQDPNQPDQVTGYNVYRSSDPALPYAQWPLEASDVTDMDQSAANLQWVDSSGDVSPTGGWYYQVAAYNGRCDAEGPW